MAKAAGIFALILGIISLTPIPMFIPVLPVWVIPVAAIVLGIIGVATSGGNYSKAPSIVGIVFGAIGLILSLTIWTFILGFLGFAGGFF